MEYARIDRKRTGERLRALCRERGVTVRDIQECLCLTYPQSIYRWFRGDALPTVENFCALSALLQARLDEMLVREEPRRHPGGVGRWGRLLDYYFRLKFL